MIKQYFTQAWAQLRQQPMISAVSIAGTALAIFLIMLVVMMQQVKVAPFRRATATAFYMCII
jgi:putative ABC transport system permease protein